MKLKLLALFVFIASQLTAQRLVNDILEVETETTSYNYFEIAEEKEDTFSMLNTVDTATISLFNINGSSLAFSFNYRIEEELPYEDGAYDYKNAYYFDFNVSYNLGDFSFSLSVENMLNLSNTNYAVEPVITNSNPQIPEYYLSHESDARIALGITYSL